jgi:hypothetical protein
LIDKYYIQGGELRGVNVGHEVLQVSAVPFKPKLHESREDGACRGKRTPGVRSRRFEFKFEGSEAGQRGEE